MAIPKRQRVMRRAVNEGRDTLEQLGEVSGVASAEPYLTDAKAFITQAVVMLRKQLVSEYGDNT